MEDRLTQMAEAMMSRHYGKYRGRLMTTGSKFAELRHRQLRMLEDGQLVLALARELVIAKLTGQAALLRQSQAGRPAVEDIERAIQQAPNAGSLDSLRGFEGSGALGNRWRHQ